MLFTIILGALCDEKKKKRNFDHGSSVAFREPCYLRYLFNLNQLTNKFFNANHGQEKVYLRIV